MEISIIIPTIGRTELKEVLNALTTQKNLNQIKLEVLVVFDGVGNDVFEKSKETFPQFKFLATGKKVFASGARNLGIKNATGEIVVFLGDDTVPDNDFLSETRKFHSKNPETNVAMIGKIQLPEKFKTNKFQKWVHNNIQFKRTKSQSWRNFQTANASIKHEFIGEERFDENFQNWGFEDNEFWFRLEKKNGILKFNEKVVVTHNHFLTLETVINNTKNARKNAKYFERKQQIKILPSGTKLIFLNILIFLSKLFPKKLFPKTYWWHVWKSSWVGKN
jgi:glycosyltransferase involved in cell wall biosynthesis